MLITMKTWNAIRDGFEQSEKDALNSAITGQTICPQGIVIDERELTPALKLKLTTAKSAATQGKFS